MCDNASEVVVTGVRMPGVARGAQRESAPARSASSAAHAGPAGPHFEVRSSPLPRGTSALRPAPVVYRQPQLIEQEAPAGAPQGYDGSANCGPTCFAMIARSMGRSAAESDAGLILRFASIGRTTLADGTELEGLEAIAASLGYGAQRGGPDVGFVEAALRRGALVIALGEYYAMAPHEDPTQREGHYVLVYGLDASGRFLVRDPADPAVQAVTAAELARFFAEHHEGGNTLAVDVTPRLSSLERVLVQRGSNAAA